MQLQLTYYDLLGPLGDGMSVGDGLLLLDALPPPVTPDDEDSHEEENSQDGDAAGNHLQATACRPVARSGAKDRQAEAGRVVGHRQVGVALVVDQLVLPAPQDAAGERTGLRSIMVVTWKKKGIKTHPDFQVR